MSSKLGSLAKFNREIPLHHKSTFDFGSFEITELDKQKVIRAEAVIAKRFKDYSEATFDICKNLYEVSLTLKAEGKFMEWCEHVRLTKDKVSELLKRYELYMELFDGREWVSSLSGKAVRILTHKDVPKELIYRVYEGGIKTADDIKQYIEYSIAADQKVLGITHTESNFLNEEIETLDTLPEDVVAVSNEDITDHFVDVNNMEKASISEHIADTSNMIEEAVIVEDSPHEEEFNEMVDSFVEIGKSVKTIIDRKKEIKDNSKIKRYKLLVQTLRKDLDYLENFLKQEEERNMLKNNSKLFQGD